MNRLPFLGIFALAAISIGCSRISSIERILEEQRANAEQGDAEAQYQLGAAYSTGSFVPEDDAVAMKWFRRAADQGHAEAQNMVGYCYEFGRGVQENDAQAMKWYRQAADQGHAEAQLRLGTKYFRDDNVPKDHVEAFAWFSIAASNGDADNNMLDYLTKNLTPEELSKAQQRTAELLKQIESREK